VIRKLPTEQVDILSLDKMYSRLLYLGLCIFIPWVRDLVGFLSKFGTVALADTASALSEGNDG
jgi:hypothetical protein